MTRNFFSLIPEDDLSPMDSQDLPIEGSDQTLKILYESEDNGNYIDFSNAFVHGELIIGSKDGENFTYLLNVEETQKLDIGVKVFSLSDDPQTTVHIEFISKLEYLFMGQLNFIYILHFIFEMVRFSSTLTLCNVFYLSGTWIEKKRLFSNQYLFLY